MNKKKLKIIGTFLAFVFYIPIYILYDKFPCFLTSIFSSSKENIVELVKVLFGSIILSGVFQKIRVITKKEKINNICFSNFIGALFSIPIFLFMYYVISKNTIITITTLLLITIIIAEFISYKIINKEDYHMENKTIIFVIIMYITFMVIDNFL